MNKVPRHLAASRRLDIGTEPDFTLGGITVHPSVREVGVGGVRETVEPRVMQVLIALARADGGVVSRDRLIELCWAGHLVGDDAINSCIAKVRALATLSSPAAFEIKTIPRVGYKLHARNGVMREAGAPAPTGKCAPGSDPPTFRLRRWTAVAGAAVAMLIAAAAWSYLKSPRSLEWVVAESHQPFIGTSLIERYPAISPDGTMLAYSAGPNLTSRQIYLRIIKGDSSLQLTHELFDATSPAWSADGKTIAYSVFQSGYPCRIMEMEIPSGTPHQLARCHTAERTELAFDPTGRALIFADSLAAGTPRRLVRLDTDNGRTVPLTDPPKTSLEDEQPAFSPDGHFLLYTRDLGGVRSEIRLRRMSDGRETIVDKFDGCYGSPAWSPDGAAVFASRNCEGSYSLWEYELDNLTANQLFASAGSIGRLSVNSNGTVAMETASGHAPILAFKPNSHRPPTPLDERSGLTSYCADFARDGALVVTGSIASQFGIWIASQEGAPFRKVMSLPQFACAIRWAPDGSRFAFVEAGRTGFKVSVVRRDGEVISHINFAAKEPDLLEWTEDGKSILTSRFEKQGWRIWRTDLATPDKSVPISAFGWRNPRVHGSMLFAVKDGVIGTWRLDGGAPRRVADGPTLEAVDLLTISGDRLYFADLTDPNHPSIATQSVYGGSKTRLMPIPFGAVDFTFAVNPTSGDIVFSPPASDNNDIGLMRLQRR